jgi:hypothetical protein
VIDRFDQLSDQVFFGGKEKLDDSKFSYLACQNLLQSITKKSLIGIFFMKKPQVAGLHISLQCAIKK